MDATKLESFSKEAQALFDKTRATFANSTDPKLKCYANKVPQSFTEGGDKINVVFAGEFSAGKSTILSLLTGKKLEIGGGITTQTCSSFDWNGITVTDTPGVHNQGRSDHDKITYDAMVKADLIVFVTTVNGFSNHVGRHFRELIIDRHKGREMMLVVNKMASMNAGNTPELQNEVRNKTFLPVVEPEFKPEDFYISYIDAQCYKESLEESDAEAKRELEKESGWAKFVDNLNKFVKEKRVLGKTTTTLHRLEQILCDANAEYCSGDLCIDGSITTLNSARNIYSETKRNIIRKCQDLAHAQSHDIYQVRDSVVMQFHTSEQQAQLKEQLERADKEAEVICNRYVGKLAQSINEEIDAASKQLGDLACSPFTGQLRSAIENECNVDFGNASSLGGVKNVASNASKFGNFLLKMSSKNPNGTIFQIMSASSSSGTVAHNVVYNVGKFFGHNFKPWGAVKFARGLAVGGKILGAVGPFVSLILDFVQMSRERKAEQQMMEARQEISQNFNKFAEAVELEFDNQANAWVEKNIDAKIREIDGEVADLQKLQNRADNESKTYNDLLLKVRQLIDYVQRT